MSDIPTNPSLLEKVLCSFISNEVRKVEVERVVVGLSGGVDSALSTYLAASALGRENVLAIKMPYSASSRESVEHADMVIAETGVRGITIDISPQIDTYFKLYPDADKKRRGNKMARERMTILYDHSAKWDALVLGTSNKTELLLGYGTVFGDIASAINPLGDLYKTQVWALSEFVGVPRALVRKQPSADLWEGQTDEADLGFSYRDVDNLLYRLVDQRCSQAELVAHGFELDFIEKITARMRHSQFKRSLPLIAKVSQRTIDRDFRYSRDWGV